mmetsp:Transcript_22169/g.56822  ORF Transcript_22169/g.56822 Transcript_22169/m.56822 type:complete len:256 (-) Transcript_22169:639-1406(-)
MLRVAIGKATPAHGGCGAAVVPAVDCSVSTSGDACLCGLRRQAGLRLTPCRSGTLEPVRDGAGGMAVQRSDTAVIILDEQQRIQLVLQLGRPLFFRALRAEHGLGALAGWQSTGGAAPLTVRLPCAELGRHGGRQAPLRALPARAPGAGARPRAVVVHGGGDRRQRQRLAVRLGPPLSPQPARRAHHLLPRAVLCAALVYQLANGELLLLILRDGHRALGVPLESFLPPGGAADLQLRKELLAPRHRLLPLHQHR